jgi:hypothetical protein
MEKFARQNWSPGFGRGRELGSVGLGPNMLFFSGGAKIH